jgi:tRNA modification GTPase
VAVRDVVVAAATPWGRSALALVRLSGEGTSEVLDRIVERVHPAPLQPGRPRRVRLRDRSGVFDDGVVVLGRAPHTYTGEETAELSCHGNPLIVERLLSAAIEAGARLAEPGEFTRRALLHGKLDLVRAEAVWQVTHATSSEGLRIGRDALDGRLGEALEALRQPLVEAAAELEARLDYPDDELAYVEDEALVATLQQVAGEASALASTWQAGRHLVQGARVALVGAVNAGKSSLFNAMVGRSRALVHPTPGTTRDVLEVPVQLDGLGVTLLDTAGERETDDPIEAAGLALARELVEEADLLIVVLRARPAGLIEAERQILARTADRPRLLVYNGVDQAGVLPAPDGALRTVATTGNGVPELRTAVRAALVGELVGNARLVIASLRQRDLLRSVAEAVEEAVVALPVAGVAVAADAVTRAIEELDALTGADTREDVLDALFARFCIGK